MKKKFELGGLKIKISWKNSRLVKAFNSLFKSKGYTLRPETIIHPEVLRERKIYRLFKEKYCEFRPGKCYGEHGTKSSSMIYYKGSDEFNSEQCLIGEFMFGESTQDFFKRKNILIKEDIHNYTVVQNDLVLSKFDKDWVEAQGQYQ